MKNNILVVDDEKDIRLSIAGLLEDENYEVRVAKNSDEALDAISERVPDLVLLDIWLENSTLDGLKLLSEIHSKFINVPCIMISGHGNIDIAVNAIRNGASDFIEKPFEAERLLITLERVLELSKLKKEQIAPQQVEDQWRGEISDINYQHQSDLSIGEDGVSSENNSGGAVAVGVDEPKPFVREGVKVGRNDPCHCGSGKKYKQCHGKIT